MDDAKIPLPKYLKLFTDNGVPVKTAMSVAGKMCAVRNTCHTSEPIAKYGTQI